MSSSLSSAPIEYQNIASNLWTASNLDPNALWAQFLAQEGLTQDPLATQDPLYLQAFSTFAQQAASKFTNAPPIYQNLFSTYTTATSAEMSAAWTQFLLQEHLQKNPDATDATTLQDFINFISQNFSAPANVQFANADPAFQAAFNFNAIFIGYTATQKQMVWTNFLAQYGFTSNPSVSSGTSDWIDFTTKATEPGSILTQLPFAPPEFQAFANSFLGTLTPSQKQAVWQQFLQSIGAGVITTLNPNLSTFVAQFSTFAQQTYIGNVNLGAPNALSPDELTKRNVVFNAFSLLLQMLQTLQNTVAVQSNNLIYLGKLQQEYTSMMSAVPTYLANPGSRDKFGKQQWIYNSNPADFSFGYGNITLKTISDQLSNTPAVTGGANTTFSITSTTVPPLSLTVLSTTNLHTALTNGFVSTQAAYADFLTLSGLSSQPTSGSDQDLLLGALGASIGGGDATNLNQLLTSTDHTTLVNDLTADAKLGVNALTSLTSTQTDLISTIANNLATVNAASPATFVTTNVSQGSATGGPQDSMYIKFVDDQSSTTSVETVGQQIGPRIELHLVTWSDFNSSSSNPSQTPNSDNPTPIDTVVDVQTVPSASDPTTLATNWENAFYSLVNRHGGADLNLFYNDNGVNLTTTAPQIYPAQTATPNKQVFANPHIPYRYTDPPPTIDSSTQDLANATQNRGEINSELQQFIENARSARQDVQNQATSMQTNVSASKEAITQATDILNNFITGLQTMLAAIAQ